MRAQIKAALDARARPDRRSAEGQRRGRCDEPRIARAIREPTPRDELRRALALLGPGSQLLVGRRRRAARGAVVARRRSGTEADFDALRTCCARCPRRPICAHPSPLHPWGFVDVRPVRATVCDASRGAHGVRRRAVEPRGCRRDPALLALARTPSSSTRGRTWRARRGIRSKRSTRARLVRSREIPSTRRSVTRCSRSDESSPRRGSPRSRLRRWTTTCAASTPRALAADESGLLRPQEAPTRGACVDSAPTCRSTPSDPR